MQVIWISLTIMWVVWFTDASDEIAKITKQFGPQSISESTALIMLIVGCILLGMFSVGTIVLFVFGQRQVKLIRQQRNFVSSVTHELRSPLSSLQLALETLDCRELQKEMQTKLVKMAIRDIERLSRLVTQILVSARLDRGLSAFEDKKVDLNARELIIQAVEQNLWLDKNLNHRITIECHEDLNLSSGKGDLSLILTNLIENAIKYSDKETPIKIKAIKDDRQVIFSVKDHGIGINPSDMRKIFRMFYRSNIASTKAVPGTGLGLFIVKSLSQSIGAKIWAESPGRGSGSIFYLSIPV